MFIDRYCGTNYPLHVLRHVLRKKQRMVDEEEEEEEEEEEGTIDVAWCDSDGRCNGGRMGITAIFVSSGLFFE